MVSMILSNVLDRNDNVVIVIKMTYSLDSKNLSMIMFHAWAIPKEKNKEYIIDNISLEEENPQTLNTFGLSKRRVTLLTLFQVTLMELDGQILKKVSSIQPIKLMVGNKILIPNS